MQVLPQEGHPLEDWTDRAAAISDIVAGVARAVEKLRHPKPLKEFELFTVEDLREIAAKIERNIGVIRKAYSHQVTLPIPVLLDIAELEARRDRIKDELQRRGELL